MNFHLYLVLPQNIPEGERFYLVTARYCLLYTAGPKPQGAKEITKISSLPHLVKEWLAGCIDRVREQALEEQKDRLLTETGPAFYAAFEQALRAEKERQDGGEDVRAAGVSGPYGETRDGGPVLYGETRAANDRPYVGRRDGGTDCYGPVPGPRNDRDGGTGNPSPTKDGGLGSARPTDKEEEKEDWEA